MTNPKPAKPARKIAVWGAGGAVLGLAMVLGGFYAYRTDGVGALTYADEEWLPVAGTNANYAARSANAAFNGTQEFWSRQFQAEFGKTYRPANLVYFTAGTPSPCAGAEIAAGPFYCYITETMALDLTFLELIGSRMFHRGEAGAALMVARISAGQVQAQLGLLDDWRRSTGGGATAPNRSLDLAVALQADCLTGVWAHHSADWLASAEPTFYGQLMLTARDIIRGRPSGTVQPDPALLGPGTPEERTAAFAQGRDAGTIAACT